MTPRFCPACAAPLVLRVPPGDERERHVCDGCGRVHYVNPRLITGAVVTWQDQLLLCRRAIEPRTGYWTFPAGFLELHETLEEGARREAWEEARARIEVVDLLGVYDLPHIGQVQTFFRARLLDPQVAAGTESLEVALFAWDHVPWADLAFPTVRRALEHHGRVRGQSPIVPDRGTGGA
jgi:ADP-ribose pyrophosphatase YjhB (NUDIX family)